MFIMKFQTVWSELILKIRPISIITRRSFSLDNAGWTTQLDMKFV
jgi:hypothetical protein